MPTFIFIVSYIINLICIATLVYVLAKRKPTDSTFTDDSFYIMGSNIKPKKNSKKAKVVDTDDPLAIDLGDK